MDTGVVQMKNNNLLKQILSSRRLKYGTSAIIIMVSAILLFMVLNLLVSLIPWQLDLTPEGLYSIGEQTEVLLDSVEEEVTIYGLFDVTKIDSSNDYIAIIDLLKKYDKYDNITVEYVDPNKNIGFMSELDPNQILNVGLRDFVVVSGDTKKLIKYYDMFVSVGSETSGFSTIEVGSKAEMAFTSAIYYVTRDTMPKIYFTMGHGEYSFDYDYITLGEVAVTNGFDHERIDLQVNSIIPEDATILMIANPSSDFSVNEIESLKRFMYQGKSIMVVLDSSDSPERYVNLQGFLRDYNIAYRYDKIKEFDENYYISGNQYMIFPGLYTQTLINNPIKDVFTNMIADNVRSIDILRKTNANLDIDPLLITSEKALSESMISSEGNEAGAKFLGAAVKDTNTESRLVVLGTADFVQDQNLYHHKPYEESGVRFMLNCFKWLEGDTDEIFIETSLTS